MDGNYHQSGDGLFLAKWNTTTYTSLAAWQAATGLEPSGVAAGHCHFVAPRPIPALTPTTLAGAIAYAPVVGSPLLNAGANMLGTYGIRPQNDFLGNLWTQNSIGAIYVTGTPNAYVAAVYADNPLMWFRLGETSGTDFADTVGTFPDGTFAHCTVGGTTIVPGDGSTSVAFNGTNSTAFTPATTHAFALTSYTVEAWVEPSSAQRSVAMDLRVIRRRVRQSQLRHVLRARGLYLLRA